VVQNYTHLLLSLFFIVYVIMFIIVLVRFFFSSRRRHTRSKRDWSSDVCSSDLGHRLAVAPSAGATASRCPARRCAPAGRSRRMRSEERRVGKECRTRRRAYNLKKKFNKHIKNLVCASLYLSIER